MDDDVQVVEQDPALLPLAFPADRAGTGETQLLLDFIHDRAHLTVVGGGTQQEHVGDDELLAHVVGDDVSCELLSRGFGRDPGELDGPGGSGHVCCSSSSVLLSPLPSHA